MQIRPLAPMPRPTPVARAAPAAPTPPAKQAERWMLVGTPALTGAGALVGTLLRGRVGGAIGALAGGLLGSALSAWPLVTNWKTLPGDQQQQVMGSAISAGSVLGGAGLGFLVGGPLGAKVGAGVGSLGLLATHLLAARQPR